MRLLRKLFGALGLPQLSHLPTHHKQPGSGKRSHTKANQGKDSKAGSQAHMIRR